MLALIQVVFLLPAIGCCGDDGAISQQERPADGENYMTRRQFADWIYEVEYHYHYNRDLHSGFEEHYEQYRSRHDDDEYWSAYACILEAWKVYLSYEAKSIKCLKKYGEKAYGIKTYVKPNVAEAPPALPYPKLPQRAPLRNTPRPDELQRRNGTNPSADVVEPTPALPIQTPIKPPVQNTPMPPGYPEPPFERRPAPPPPPTGLEPVPPGFFPEPPFESVPAPPPPPSGLKPLPTSPVPSRTLPGPAQPR